MNPSDIIKVLLIDDSPEFVDVVRLQLNQFQDGLFDMTAVELGEDALQLLEKGADFDIIVIDYYLPDMDGIELLRAICDRGKDIPSVFLTVTRDINVAIDALKLGVKDYLMKEELTGGLLPKTLKTIVERRRLLLEREDIEVSQKRLEAMREVIMDIVKKIEEPLLEMRSILDKLEQQQVPENAAKYVKIVKDNLRRIEEKKERLKNLKEDRTVKYIKDITMIDLS